MTYDTDVLIAGAGPVGLTLANELLRHGITPRIIDRASGIREVSKAMILHVRTQEALDRVGIASRARAEAEPLTEVVVHAYGKHIGSWDLDDIDSPYKHPLIIGQNKTQHILLDLLEGWGGKVDWNSELASFTMNQEGVLATIKGPSAAGEETVRAKYVVGCEGSNSVVRKAMNFTFEGERYTGEQFIQADCRIKWALPAGRSYLFLTSDGYMMVIEFPEGMVRVFISLPDTNTAGGATAANELGAVEAANEEPTLDEIQRHLVRLSGFDAELSNPTWLARYRTSHRYSNRFSQGRAFIAGDAAHVHVPIGGQGMNTGIQDAFNLGWKLAGVINGSLKEGIIDTYHDERHPVARQLIEGTNFAYKGVLHPSEIQQRAARMFGPYLIRSSRIQNFMRNTLEELSIAYTNSSLCLDCGGGKGPRAGERVLDATLVRNADKATVTLNELTRTTSWTLLLFGGLHGDAAYGDLAKLQDAVILNAKGRVEPLLVFAEKSAPESMRGRAGVFLDTLHLAHETYGISDPALYLLRPDTFVGFRGPLGAAKDFLGYIEKIFT